MSRLRSSAPTGLAGIFAVTGVLHLARPSLFDQIMPRVVPTRLCRPFVYGSGVAELVCSVGLIRRKSWAAAAATAVLLSVWQANLQMALDA